MGFNNRTPTPLKFSSSPLLPQADSSQGHDIPTGVSPTTSKTHDWIAALALMVQSYRASSENWAAIDGVTTWNSPASGALSFLDPDTSVDPVEIQIADCEIGDVVTVTLTANIKVEHPSGGLPACYLRFSAEQDVGGAGTTSDLLCRILVPAVDNGTVYYPGASLTTVLNVTVAGTSRLFVRAAVPSGETGLQLHLYSWNISAIRVRA